MLIANNKEGLCNRLKALLSVMHLSPDDYGLQWPIEGTGIQCEFNDLFENKISSTSSLEIKYDSWRFALNKKLYSNETNNQLSQLFKGKIDRQYNNAPVELQNIYHDLCQKLIPVKYVRDEVKKEIRRWHTACINLQSCVSIHVRSWGDNRPNQKLHWKEGMNNFDIQDYIDAMKKFRSDTMFFVSSDNHSYARILYEEFDGYDPNRESRVYFRPKRKGIPGGKEQMQDALIDLILLGKAPYLIGTKVSTFSELAWYWSELKNPPILLGGR